jgi:hypothetical protein
MTQQEWLQATNPTPMLKFLQEKVSDRKLRLFAVACCRRVWHLLTDEISRRAIETAERYADGEATAEELRAAEQAATDVSAEFRQPSDMAMWVASTRPHLSGHPWQVLFNWAAEDYIPKADRVALLHELFHNPFRPITLDLSSWTWHDGLLVSMAQRMYDRRDFSDIAVLADALEEAGCQDQDILGHCRSGGEHVRGCWVVDLLLGKK